MKSCITSSLLADSVGTMLIFCIETLIFVPLPARTFRDSPQQWHTSLNWISRCDAQNFLKVLGDIKGWLSVLRSLSLAVTIRQYAAKLHLIRLTISWKFHKILYPEQTLIEIRNIDSIWPFPFTVQKPVWQTHLCTFTKTGAFVVYRIMSQSYS